MEHIQETCYLKVLVLASLNREVNIVTDDYNWEGLFGKKLNVFSLRESVKNLSNEKQKFHVIWNEGENEEEIFAKHVKFNGWAGSSFNIADHLKSLGMIDVTLAAFVDQGPQLKDLHDYLSQRGIKFIPLWASNTGVTFVFEDEERKAESIVCMEKPAKIETSYNRNKLLEQSWDVIICSSTPENINVLNLMIEIFSNNPNAIKTLMPSLKLIQSEDRDIKKTFQELISMTTIFQVNDLEAGRYLSLLNPESPQKPLYRRKLVMDLVKQLYVPVLIVTMGEWGSAVVVSDHEKEPRQIHQEALKPKWSIKSTVGSGDAFHAGFVRVYAQAEEKHNDDSLDLATRMGSEMAIRNLCTWGANMSQDESKKMLPIEFLSIVRSYR
ncbi:MAG: PfkB family carbohydrate kinase [Patescibacteria group bacterium]|nr:PfkB family carbohydrate kinase [Patescibacteria group bacterium]MDD4304381.1 PfkB family carbohydrate kinase [Patescibacteria group bacterium]MDD4695404.1 PfkB family carbohydrate kinase [Patescibacteria group bacterium]